MAGILSGLAGLGLENLENLSIYEQPEKETEEKEVVVVTVEEKDLIYDKTFECPVCGRNFTSKIMKTGKAKLIKTDQDLRTCYEGIDAVKYDVVLCPSCGYAAVGKYFPMVGSGQAKMIQENISKKIRLQPHTGEIYSYDEAVERYQLALANAVVKRAKSSEKAYICLKSAWLFRGYAESIELEDPQKVKELKAKEDEYIENAYNGFTEARKSEGYPMCGMDELTVDYLLAVLSLRLKKYDVSARLIAAILTSPAANNRIKDKARDLKDELLAELKRK